MSTIALSDIILSLPSRDQCTRTFTGPNGGISVCLHSSNYVAPTFSCTTPQRAARVLSISAAGAVGKSTLARHLAHKTGNLLWDISSIVLGDNSFIGTIANAFGMSEGGRLIDSIKSGTECLIIDGFDEAEIVSGWGRVEAFLREVYLHIASGSGSGVSIILLSRSETSRAIDRTIDSISGAESITTKMSINYFDEQASVDFVLIKLKNYCDVTVAQKFIETIRESFTKVIGINLDGDQDETHDMAERVRSFTGYAPVLEAIARALDEDTNAYRAVQEAAKNQSCKTAGAIIDALLSGIIIRETEKVRTALITNGLSKKIDASSTYDLASQMRMIIAHLLFGRASDALQIAPLHNINPNELDQFKSIVDSFIPQHPFMSNGQFAGPAFRDYCLAKLIADDNYSWLATEYLELNALSPSPMMAITYQNSTNKANASSCRFIYDSCLSMVSSKSGQRINISIEGDINSYSMVAEISNLNGSCDLLSFGFVFHKDQNPLWIGRRSINTTVDISGTFRLGHNDGSLSIADTAISCHTLQIHAREIYVASSERGSVALRASQSVETLSKVRVTGPVNSLSCWFPGVENSHPWRHFQIQDPPPSGDQNSIKFALHSILKWFRRDKKKEIAKHSEMIDNIAVSGGTIKKLMLKFLLHVGILERSQSMYLFNERTAGEYGISYSAIKGGDLGAAFPEFCTAFERFSSTQPE